ncbi:M57 family metalloprotease [Chitinophaga solisilvae]|uniref:M57 family metalloprotease n=1 Tax=Chitinophaga solisilvae TaxID=1233460 RepID=UPI001F3A88FE|nr:M57 family metalloprotease [Chitinophaga solisilvae]
MKHSNGFFISAVICMTSLTLLFSSCSKNEKELQVPSPAPNAEEMTNYLVNQGFDREHIVFDKDRVVIESDIIMSLSDLKQRTAEWKAKPETEHRRGTYIVSNTYNTNIKFYLDPAIPQVWRTAIQGAVNNWNAVNGTRLGMSIVSTQAGANTRVFMGYENANWIARAYLPGSDSRPGVTVEINSKYNSMSASQQLFAITHEFGHTIGFHHTNQATGVFINGTPTSDPNSVMNSTVLPWNGFTAGDVRATQILYPQ